jgi:hypothetical protein
MIKSCSPARLNHLNNLFNHPVFTTFDFEIPELQEFAGKLDHEVIDLNV